MLLLDSSNLSVFEATDEILSNRTQLPPSISYERFETTARSHFCSLFLAAQFPAFRVGAETLVFVRLTEDRGWAWASRIRVRHLNELPVSDAYIGEEFLFLWPVPMAMNAYINFKEKARRLASGGGSSENAFVSAIKAHPPSLTFVPQHLAENSAIGTLKRISAKDMTAAQRLFVASLTPHASAFSVRSPGDKWSDALRDKDQSHLRNFLCTKPKEAVEDDGTRSETRLTRGRARKRQTRGGGGGGGGGGCVAAAAAFDLPDDLVERILSIHISQTMDSAVDMHVAIVAARFTCHQFRSAATAAMTRMLSVVTKAAHSLLGSDPMEPGEVQTLVHAAGITLRQALMLSPSRWDYYLRLRKRQEVADDNAFRPVPPGSAAARRCALLWGIAFV